MTEVVIVMVEAYRGVRFVYNVYESMEAAKADPKLDGKYTYETWKVSK